MSFYIVVMFASWLMVAISSIFFRKPGVPFFYVCWKPWRPSDYVTPTGALLWGTGITVFTVGWLLGFVSLVR